jgi:6-phosphogluconolactonase (cycloisomerase 2 family)
MTPSLGARRRPVRLDSRKYFAPSKPHRHILFGCKPTRTLGISLIVLIGFVSGCGGGSYSAPPPSVNPVPSIASLSPSSTIVAAQAQTLTIQGSNFLSNSAVTYNSQPHTPTFMSSTQLSISLSASDQATAGNFAVIVSNPAPGGGQSNSANFTVNNPQPSLASVSPSVLAGGSPDTIVSVVGANFVAQSTVNLNSAALPTTFVSATQLNATVPASSLASGRVNRVSVTSSAPGGGTSASLNLIVTELLPAGVSGPLIQSLPPTAALVGKLLQYQALAASANSSSLVFSLSTAPTGMAVNAGTGLLQWTPASNQVGDQPVTIVAKDSGGQTSQSFTLSVFGSRVVASATISAAAGGVITVSDPTSKINGLSISIPGGALATDTTITVSELVSPPTLGGTPRFLLKGFSVDPDGTPLAIPAQITIPYSTSEFDSSQGIPLEDFLGVYFLQTSTGMLENLDSFSVDKVNHVLTGTVPHFSAYLSTNIARLCPPPAAGSDCPDTYAPATPSSLLLPAVLVHGFTFNIFTGETMGNEKYWGGQEPFAPVGLRYKLGQLDSGNAGRIDAWRFDWDSNFTTFEISAGNLDAALAYVEHVTAALHAGETSPPPHLVNLVAHSFGGILVRTYLEGQAKLLGGTVPYRNDVNRVMTLGTPHSGIGGNLSTFYANACAADAQGTALLPLLFPTPEPITCFEASTGIAAIPGALKNTGAFLKALNGKPLPPLESSLRPQYDLIAGQRFECAFVITCALQKDDGLITTAGNELCGTLTGSGGFSVVCSQLTDKKFKEEINPGNVPPNTGLCHSSALFVTTCSPGNNTAMTEVHDEGHPLWGKICTFLGCTLVPRTLTVTSTNPGSGVAITASPAVNSGQTSGNTPFTLIYESGTMVTLSAPPTAGANNFSNWTGCDSVLGTICKVTMNADRTVNANYALPTTTRTLTVASTNPGSGVAITVSPADNSSQGNGTTQFTRSYNNGAVVTLGAPATATGNNFSSWTGCDSVSGTSCTVTMNADRPVTANYAPPITVPHALTVASTNPGSGVAITVSPADNNVQTNGTTQFTRTYNNGVVVSLSAPATAGANNFSSWTGCDGASGTTCTVTMNTSRTVTANYAATLPTSLPGFAYVANQFSNDVSAYKVDPASGALTPIATFTSGLAPNSVAANPAGHCLYVANQQDSTVPVAVFTINATTGALTPGPAPPVSVSDFFPVSIAVNSTGTFAYIANLGGTVSVFAIDAGTCGLTRISGSPFAAGTLPSSLALDPTGAFLYVTNEGNDNISAYTINSSTGALTPMIGSPFPTGSFPTSITVHPTGKFAFATNGFGNTVSVYKLDQSTGVLTPITGSPFPTGQGPFSVAVEPLGKFVYIPNVGDNNVFAYSFDAAAVAPTPTQITSSPFPTGTTPIFVIADPSGKFLYVANNGSTSVSAFQIDANSGTLTPILPVGFFPAGGGPISMTITALPAH